MSRSVPAESERWEQEKKIGTLSSRQLKSEHSIRINYRHFCDVKNLHESMAATGLDSWMNIKRYFQGFSPFDWRHRMNDVSCIVFLWSDSHEVAERWKMHRTQYDYYQFRLATAEISIACRRSSMQRWTEIRSFMKFAIFSFFRSLSSYLHWLHLLLIFIGFHNLRGPTNKNRQQKGKVYHATTLCSTLFSW